MLIKNLILLTIIICLLKVKTESREILNQNLENFYGEEISRIIRSVNWDKSSKDNKNFFISLGYFEKDSTFYLNKKFLFYDS